MSAWTSGVGAQLAGPGAVTVLHGTTFALAAANGDMDGTRPHGFFFRDTRFISGWRLQVNGKDMEPLVGTAIEPYRAMFVGRVAGSSLETESHVLVERHRSLNGGMVERIVVHNYSNAAFAATIHLEVAADFADLFDVKAGIRRPVNGALSHHRNGGLEFSSTAGGHRLLVAIRDAQGVPGRGGLEYRIELPPQGEWATEVAIAPSIDGQGPEQDARMGQAAGAASIPAVRQQAWKEQVPSVEVSHHGVGRALVTGRSDLGSLRIFDPEHEGRVVVAAGAPWFMALFGRDSLLASFLSLSVDASLALGTIQTLAERQGTQSNPQTEEEPGKILHEVRLGSSPSRELGRSGAYFGSVDATPLFVTMAGELTRWGVGGESLHRLMPAVDAALGWIERTTARNPHGFLTYQRSTPTGLANQGWKDSWDGVTFADGQIAEAPLALCEVQGYVYTAYLARALIAQQAGDGEKTRHYATKARRLKAAFNDRFWLADRGHFALAIDGEGRQVDSCASNMGHSLWSGIVDLDKAPLVAGALMSQDMFTGWGVRTLSSRMKAYNPASYHNGSVWPHENALIAGGLMRYGFIAESQRVASSLMQAAEFLDGRLPELFCGLDRGTHPVPVPYPTSCSPQAWAAAAPMHLLRIMLRFDPVLTEGRVYLDPVLPADWGEIHLRNITVGNHKINLTANGTRFRLEGVPEDLEVRRGLRGPLADMLDVMPEKK
ncbi:amylo-alpha-1,6-glucosidase [Paeniglutamicibacter sp. ABSL32-1]|uniref:amylo-alpha-1,6-glucosidase n=1 Tax=Paeniglutamicibacter quisquiliarum TaxID=2849498 RepID=UPI001C2D5B5A|nr:amylo-alpha-1,6-glucosidase [Paeniglutamicibacter quisquiliarum]